MSREKLKICKICNEYILLEDFVRDSKNHYDFHSTCIEKILLLLKIKNSKALNIVDFKSLEVLFEILYEDIPIDLISNLEEELNAHIREVKKVCSEKQKGEIELDQKDYFTIKILLTGYVIRCNRDKQIMKYYPSLKTYFCDGCGLVITIEPIEIKEIGFTKLTEEELLQSEQDKNAEIVNISKVTDEFVYLIETKKYPEEVIKILKEKNISFDITKIHDLTKESNVQEEEIPLIEIDLKIFRKLKKLLEITGIPIEDIANTEIKGFLRDHVSEEPLIFLDKYLGFKNVKDPISVIEKLNDVVNISEEYIEWLKSIDLNAYVDDWNNPLKTIKNSNK